MIESLKEVYKMLKENTQSVIMTALMAGACVIYSDFKEYIHDATIYQRAEAEKQHELNQEFLKSLNSINYRLEQIERNVEGSNK